MADILRALTVGNGRISKAQEATLEEKNIASEFDGFIDALVDSFPVLASLEADDLSARLDLRAESLIGSNVNVAGFAAAWFELKSSGWSAAKVQTAFSDLRLAHGAGLRGSCRHMVPDQGLSARRGQVDDFTYSNTYE